jgi:hypothetical protein
MSTREKIAPELILRAVVKNARHEKLRGQF